MCTVYYRVLKCFTKTPTLHNIVKILSKCSVKEWYILKEVNFVRSVKTRVPNVSLNLLQFKFKFLTFLNLSIKESCYKTRCETKNKIISQGIYKICFFKTILKKKSLVEYGRYFAWYFHDFLYFHDIFMIFSWYFHDISMIFSWYFQEKFCRIW